MGRRVNLVFLRTFHGRYQLSLLVLRVPQLWHQPHPYTQDKLPTSRTCVYNIHGQASKDPLKVSLKCHACLLGWALSLHDKVSISGLVFEKSQHPVQCFMQRCTSSGKILTMKSGSLCGNISGSQNVRLGLSHVARFRLTKAALCEKEKIRSLRTTERPSAVAFCSSNSEAIRARSQTRPLLISSTAASPGPISCAIGAH